MDGEGRFEAALTAVVREVSAAVLRLPAPVVTALAGRPRPVRDGQRLDAQVHAVIESRRRLGLPDLEALTPERARVEFRRQARLVDAAPTALARVEDLEVPGAAGPLPARLYVPEAAAGPGPLLVYFHGGGFVVGDVASHDPLCRLLAHRADVRVLSVGYRLAPEHPFPAAWEDALAAWRWVVEAPGRLGAAPGRIAVGGDSAGGNLAAGVALGARDGAVPLPTFSLLFYPALDLTRSFPSHRTFADGFLLTASLIDWFLALYLRDADDARDPRASPWFAARLDGLPPTLLVTAGFDPLRDEGRRWADALRDAGVPVRYHDHPTLVHGFVTMTGAVAEARRAVDDAARVLREALR